MRIVYLNSDSPYIIGKQGENNAVTLRVDVTEWVTDFPGGTGVILFTRPNKVVYPLETSTTVVGGKTYLQTIITAQENKVPGWVVLQAQWYNGETLVKSMTFSGKVLVIGDGTSVDPTETIPNWVADWITTIENAGPLVEAAKTIEDNLAASRHAAAQAAASASEAMTDTPEGYANVVASISPTYDGTKTYAVGAYCMNGGKLYRCTTAITEAETTFNSAHWTQVDVGTEVSNLNGIVNDSILVDASVSWNLTNGYIKLEDGGVQVADSSKRTEFMLIPENVKGLYYTCPVSSIDLQVEVIASVAFYTTNDVLTYISDGSAGIKSGTANGFVYSYLPIPATAKYMRLCVLAAFADSYELKYVKDINAKIDQVGNRIDDTAIVANYAALLTSTAKKVLVLCNDYPYGDYGPCWFKVTPGWTKDGITRNDGSVVYPLPDQGTLVAANAPYNKIMDIIKSYVGNPDLEYGNTYGMFDTTCDGEMDCSTFVTAVLSGIPYGNSRYIEGNASNIIGDHIGNSMVRHSGNNIIKGLSYKIGQFYAMQKRLYRFPTTSFVKAINMLQFGDILFSHSDGVNDDAYYGIGHVAIVLGTIPAVGVVIVAQAGGGGNVSNEPTDVKTSCRILDNADKFVSDYPVFARPDYGADNAYTNLISAIVQTATTGKYYLTTNTGLKLQLNTRIDDNGALAYSKTLSATCDYIEVPENGSIIYNGSQTGIDEDDTPYVATIYRYDADKKFISRNGILIENLPVSQQFTKSGQAKPTKYIRLYFGHTSEQDVTTTLADLDRFSAEITVS